MRLNLRLPEVKPDHFVLPRHCPTSGCKGKRFYPRQKVKKKVVDAKYKQVAAWRYQCGACGHTFRRSPRPHACPCGYYGDSLKSCTCAPVLVTKYQKRISGPLLDHIDIHIEVPRVDYEKLSGNRVSFF
jgi:hypothetical protein